MGLLAEPFEKNSRLGVMKKGTYDTWLEDLRQSEQFKHQKKLKRKGCDEQWRVILL